MKSAGALTVAVSEVMRTPVAGATPLGAVVSSGVGDALVGGDVFAEVEAVGSATASLYPQPLALSASTVINDPRTRRRI